jgi:hypothetical protein
MERSDARRLHNDLATLRTLLHFELPFEAIDVRALFSMGLAALLPAGVGAAGGRDPRLLLASCGPYLALLGYFLVRNYLRASRNPSCPAAKRREYRVGLPIMLLSLVFLLGSASWAKAAGAPGPVADAYFLLFLGWLLLYHGLYEPGRRANLLIAVPMIGVALAWPFVSGLVMWTSLWLAIGLGMIAAAACMRWQLNSLQRREAPTARGETAHGAD